MTTSGMALAEYNSELNSSPDFILEVMVLKRALIKREHLFGISPCLAALNSLRRNIYKVYVNEKFKHEDPQRPDLLTILHEFKKKDFNIKYKSKDLMNRISGNHLHQNVIMSVSPLKYQKLDKNLKPATKNPFWLVLDQVQDPMNLGAIIRSSTYFGVDKLIVTEQNSCSLTPVVSKASAGAMEYLDLFSVSSLKNLLKRATSAGWTVYGTQCLDEIEADVISCEKVELDRPTILVLGNEGRGLDENVLRHCSKMVTITACNQNIPVTLDSLNVSVASGILLHAFLAKRITEANEVS